MSWKLVTTLSILEALPLVDALSILPRLDNGLAQTPPMGWNSYNHYSCAPNESIIHSNTQALVDLGLQAAGYHYVTVDCGWTLPNRTANGTLTWNPARFPSGYPALANFIHSFGLAFGVYSDGGVQDCMTGEPAQAGSLGYERVDALTFASWGADSLKYDNCYSDAASGYPDAQYTPSTSPEPHYVAMSSALQSLARPLLFQICDWGIDFPSLWAPSLGNTWRITNDIIPAWRTIPRILNQAVPSTPFAGPAHWPDLDMLEVGNNVFTTPEEQTHFSLWAILKSPLTIGAALQDSYTNISSSSVAILKNTDVIGFNQDPLGVSANFTRRWTEEEYEVWSGPLSGNRTVVAIINGANVTRNLTLDLPDVGLQSAAMLKNIWNGESSKDILTSYTASVEPHGTILLELNATTPVGLYSQSALKGSRNLSTKHIYHSVYGSTTSASYNVSISFSTSSSKAITFTVSTNSGPQAVYTLTPDTLQATVPISLRAGNDNTLSIVSPVLPSTIFITPPPPAFYPSTSFAISGNASRVTCHTGGCAPVGARIGNLSAFGSASKTIAASSDSSKSGTQSKLVDVFYTNNDIALATSWTTGTNTRNMTLTVNNIITRIEVPLSGRSSELFSPGLGWEDTGVFKVLVPGFGSGRQEDVVTVGNVYGPEGLVAYGADFVGLGIYW